MAVCLVCGCKCHKPKGDVAILSPNGKPDQVNGMCYNCKKKAQKGIDKIMDETKGED